MSINKKVLVVDERSTLNNLIKEFVDKSKPYFGFACIVNKNNQLKGVFNSGDLLRALNKGFTTDCLVSEVMTKTPITIFEDELFDNTLETKLNEQFHNRFGSIKKYTKYIPIITRKGILKDIRTYEEVVKFNLNNIKSVSIWGLGYVGITLSAAIGSKGFKVIGIDKEANKKC